MTYVIFQVYHEAPLEYSDSTDFENLFCLLPLTHKVLTQIFKVGVIIT